MVIQNLRSESEEVRQYSLATTLEIIRNNRMTPPTRFNIPTLIDVCVKIAENQKEVFQMAILPTLISFLTEAHNNITHYLTLGVIWSLTKKSGNECHSIIRVLSF